MNTEVVKDFRKRLENLEKDYRKLTSKKNKILKKNYNGIYYRYKNPVITAWQVPLTWRYDLKPETNPYLMQRIGVNSAFNRGAINIDRKYLLIVSSEVWDRKSFFAVAESPNGIDNFRFWVRLPHFILHYGQQRNLVLHPEFMNGKHAFYTRPQDGFIEVEAG